MSARKIVKIITQNLLSKPTWKIIVRNNSWLCPYCGEIGARQLSMNEQIEGKIAHHLTNECERWNQFQAPEIPLDDLRRKAKLIIFKIKVGKWILSDRRYSMATVDGRWFCPYCGAITDIRLPQGDPRVAATYGEAPEKSPFLTAVSRHFLQCSSFEREDLKSQQELDAIKARTERQNRSSQIVERFKREPEWQLLDAERNWLCPFCAAPTNVKFPDQGPNQEFFGGIGEHLLVCRSYKTLRGRPRPVQYLKDKVAAMGHERRLAQIREKIQSHAIWRCRDALKRWYCPYCAELGDITYPGERKEGSKVFEEFVDKVLDHLRRCRVYRQRKATIRTKEQMLEVLNTANARLKRNHELRKRMLNNPLFGVVTDDRAWVCPYCIAIIDEVEVDPDKSELRDDMLFEPIAEKVYAHLKTCEKYRPGREPGSTIEDLQGEAMQRSVEIGDDELGVTQISNEWARLREEIEYFESAEQDMDLATRTRLSLQVAEATRKRLLPNLPQIPGYDFAAEQIACEQIGGDFYDFFSINDEVWGIALGSISEYGVEATLTMGLTKKLLQSHGRRSRSAVEVLALTNQDIYEELDDDTYVTAFYGFLNVRTRALMFARAGHNPLVIYNPKRTPRLNVFQTKGMALGMDRGDLFSRSLEQRNLQLAQGDVFIQFSNGLVQATNDQSEPFGHARLYELIERHGNEDAEYLAWKIRRAVQDWQGNDQSEEDMTLITMKFL